MKHIFLDFDGVLHATGSYAEKFEHMNSFCNQLKPFIGKFKVIISSSWRESFDFKDLRDLFPDFFQSSVTGITPVVDNNLIDGARHKEIMMFCNNKGVSSSQWIALDDMAHLFPKDCTNLILTDKTKGLSQENIDKLIDFIKLSPSLKFK